MYQRRNCHGLPAPTVRRYQRQPCAATMYITKWNTCGEQGTIAALVTITRISAAVLGVGINVLDCSRTPSLDWVGVGNDDACMCADRVNYRVAVSRSHIASLKL